MYASLGGPARRGLRNATPANERTDRAVSRVAQADPLVRRGANPGPAAAIGTSPLHSRGERRP
jgi:hypothetical protein